MIREHLHNLWLRLKALLKRRQLDGDLAEELQFHLAMREENLVKGGMSPADAHDAARREFGNVASLKEASRNLWSFPSLESLGQDVRYGLRQLRRDPGLTALAVLALAVGLGANSAIFSLAEAVLFPPFIGANPSRLAAIYTSGEHASGYASTSYPDYLYYREHSRSFSSIAAFVRVEAAWTHGDSTELPWAEVVSSNYFDTLGVKPFRGRFFLPSENHTAPAPVAVVSYDFWRDDMSSSSQLDSYPLMLNGSLFTVVGVAPKGFEGVQLNWGGSPDFWLPMSAEPRFLNSNLLNVPSARWCLIAGRLQRDVTLGQAGSEIRFLARQLEGVYPEADKGRTAIVLPFNAGRIWPTWREKITQMVSVLSFFAGLVLFVACADVANLLLARGAARHREVGVRLALGASRARILRQLLTEASLVSLAGASFGMVLAYWMCEWFTKFRDLFTVRLSLHPAVLDGHVFAFTLVLAIATVVIFGLAPAFQVSGLDLNASLKESGLHASVGGRRQLVSHGLVVAAVSIAFIAVAGAAILLHTLWALDSTDLGLNPRRVLAVSTEVFTRGYKTDEARRFYVDLLDRVRFLPGVQSATLAFNSPLTTMHSFYSVEPPEMTPQRPEAWRTIEGNSISPGYFKTLGIPLLRGRDFRPEDDQQTPPVVIVSQAMARMFWPHEDAIGRPLRIKGVSAPAEVVGIVGDVKQHGPWQVPEAFFYRPFAQSSFLQSHVLVRTHGDPMAFLPMIRKEVSALDPEVPVYGAQSMEQMLADSTAEPRMTASLVSLFGALVLFLAIAGIYGVISYWVAQRTREIGIRVALGAQKSDVLMMVVGEGIKLVSAGVGLGIVGALAVTRLLSSMLYGVDSSGPLTFIGVAFILIIVALLASYIPAHRASKVDPIEALRYE